MSIVYIVVALAYTCSPAKCLICLHNPVVTFPTYAINWRLLWVRYQYFSMWLHFWIFNRPRLPSNLKQMLIFTPLTLTCEVAHKRFNDFITSIKQESYISRLKSKHFVIQQITFPNVKFLMRSFSFEQFPN